MEDNVPLPVRTRTGPVWSGIWMSLACALFVVMAVFVRLLSETQSAYEITFYRGIIGALFIAPLVMRPGGVALGGPVRWVGYFKRVIFLYLAMLTYFVALGAMNMADAIALNSAIPIFTVLFAGIILGEMMTVRRWGAILFGFVGVLIIIRPGFAEFGWPAILALASAAFYAMSGIELKILARSEPANRIIFYQNVVMTPLALIPALFFWHTPSWAQVPEIIGLGVSGALAHMCSTRAYAAADISFASVFDSVRLPLAAIVGAVLFGDRLEVWVAVGGVIIIASSVYLAQHEARNKSPETKRPGTAGK
ncbi:MAG: DMT family transporter [Alphaproteobacteria bacterium]